MRLDRNFANGRFIEPAAPDELIAVYNPATEVLVGHVRRVARPRPSQRSSRGRRSKGVARAAFRRARAFSSTSSPTR